MALSDQIKVPAQVKGAVGGVSADDIQAANYYTFAGWADNLPGSYVNTLKLNGNSDGPAIGVTPGASSIVLIGGDPWEYTAANLYLEDSIGIAQLSSGLKGGADNRIDLMAKVILDNSGYPAGIATGVWTPVAHQNGTKGSLLFVLVGDSQGYGLIQSLSGVDTFHVMINTLSDMIAPTSAFSGGIPPSGKIGFRRSGEYIQTYNNSGATLGIRVGMHLITRTF